MANASLKQGRALFPISLTRALLLSIWLLLPLSLVAQESLPRELWRYQAEGTVCGVAVDPQSGLIFCGSADRHLHCLDRSRALLWKYKAGGIVRGVAVDPKHGQILCGFDHNHLHCLDRSGALLWRYKTGGYVFGVAVDPENGQILCSSGDQQLHCLDHSGALLWKYKTEGWVRGLAIDPQSGQILCGSGDQHLHCLDRSGTLLWKYPAGGHVLGVAVDPENGQILCGSDHNHLHCLDHSGALLWKYPTGGTVYGVVVDPQSGLIFCSSEDNLLHCLDRSGSLLWKYPLPTNSGWYHHLALDPTRAILFCPSGRNLCAISYGLSKQHQLEEAAKALQAENCSLQEALARESAHTQTLQQQVNTLSQTILTLQEQTEILEPEHALLQQAQKSLLAINAALSTQIASQQEENRALSTTNQLLEHEIDHLRAFVDEVQEERAKQTMDALGVSLEVFPITFDWICSPCVQTQIYAVATTAENTHTLHGLTQHFEEVYTKEFAAIFSENNPPVVDSEENIYFLSQERELCQLSGQQTFILLDKERYSSPTVGDHGLLYLSSEGGTLYALDPETGGIMWTKKTSQTIYPTPCVNREGVAYFASQTTLYAISPTGQSTQTPLQTPAHSPIRIDPQGNLYYLSAPDTLTCINPTGEILWHYAAKDLTLPAFDNDYIYVASETKIHCLNLEGESIWQRETHTPIKLPPTSNSKGEIYFLSEEGKLYRKRELSLFEKYLG